MLRQCRPYGCMKRFKIGWKLTDWWQYLKNSILKFKTQKLWDRAKLTKFWDHMFCQCSQQNIFQHFEKFQNILKKLKILKKHKFAHISSLVIDRAKRWNLVITCFFVNVHSRTFFNFPKKNNFNFFSKIWKKIKF